MYFARPISCFLLVATFFCVSTAMAKQLTIDPGKPCGGMPVMDANPEELLPLLGEGAGWTLEWKATCMDMGGSMMGVKIPRSRVLAARYVKGQDAVAVTLTVSEDPAQRSGTVLDVPAEAAQYSMVKPLKSEKITYAGKEAYTGVLGGMGEYRQDVLDVMLSKHTLLSIQREYSAASKPMDMVEWADDVLSVGSYSDPAWLKGK
jgi:hypothetical protein